MFLTAYHEFSRESIKNVQAKFLISKFIKYMIVVLIDANK